ncbi:MAG TPA: alpha/beta hydrolase-fold protein [Candidatus Sulfomarinibacteraceae bacterium]|nr:alpha/beta hydrolase-fold protein [Candidatus Sulfomarinibacteraceae bacterium]
MRGKVCCVVIVALAAALAVQAGGTVTVESIYSEALGENRSVLVYLPEGYTSSGRDYPVIYYLHGAGGQPGAWYLTDYFPVLDDLIADGVVDPAIIVEPDSATCASPLEWRQQGLYGRLWTFHANSDLLGHTEDYLAEDLVAWVDDRYHTVPDRDHRLIVARSMGGHGAMRLTMRHPETFGGASIDAGFMEILDDQVMRRLTYVRALTPGPPYDFSPLNDAYSEDVFNFCAAFTPNLANPPWFVDFILDSDGEVDQSVYQRMAAQSVTALVADYAASDPELPVDLFFRIGDHDEFADTFWPVIDALETNSVPHLLRVFGGSHWVPDDGSKIAVQMSYFMPLKATAELSPRVADPRLHPNLLRVAVELPGDLDVADIDCSTLALIDIDGARLDCPIGCTRTCEVSDVNGNGRDDLSVWLPCDRVARAAVDAGASAGDQIELTIRGELTDGRFFAAADTVTLGAEPDPVAVD